MTATFASFEILLLSIVPSTMQTTAATIRQTFSYGMPCPENRKRISSLSEFTFVHSNRHAWHHAVLRLHVNADLEGREVGLSLLARLLEVGKARGLRQEADRPRHRLVARDRAARDRIALR